MSWRRAALVVLAFCLMLMLYPASGPASAASSVKVTIFKPAIEINGHKINNVSARYPVLVYKGIAYFPLSSEYAKALGMSVQWSRSKGLTIYTVGSRTPLKQAQKGANSLNRSYSAQIASLPVQIDDTKINNAKEKYPILQFRDVTYFPIVPRFTRDLFHWDVEGSFKTGYRIRSNQYPVLYEIVYDGNDYLYVNSGTEGLLKISKKLDGKFEYITEKESRSIWAKHELANRGYSIPEPGKEDVPVTSNGKSVFYRDQELVSLVSYKKKEDELMQRNPLPDSDRGISFDYQEMKVTDGKSILVVTVFYMNGIPGPYTPHENHVFVIQNGQASKVTGFNQWPNKLGKILEGTIWISSPVPFELTASNYDMVGQLALIDENGVSYNINEQLEVRDIDLLHADSQSLLIKAYNDRFEYAAAGEKDGIYSIDLTTRKITKVVNSMRGVAFVDNKKQVFILDPAKNTITNMMTKNSHRWWDYELRRDI